MVMFLNKLMRKNYGKTVGTDLVCPLCYSKKLRYVESYGYSMEVWKCRSCNQTFRYNTTPWDPMDKGMSSEEAAKDMSSGMAHKEITAFGDQQRAKKRNLIHLPGIGTFRMRRSKKRPKD